MIEVERRIAGHLDQAEDLGDLEQPADRINPQSAILVQPRVAAELLDARERPKRDHLVRLIAVEPVADDDLGALAVVGVEHDRPSAADDGIRVDIRPDPRRIPRRQGGDLLARPRRLVAEEERIDVS
jgi:hypothetical protein